MRTLLSFIKNSVERDGHSLPATGLRKCLENQQTKMVKMREQPPKPKVNYDRLWFGTFTLLDVDELEMAAKRDHGHGQMREEVRARGTKRQREVQAPPHLGERISKRSRRDRQKWMEGDGARDAYKGATGEDVSNKGRKRVRAAMEDRLEEEKEEEAQQWYRGYKGLRSKRRKGN